jgi:hypothetical protein
VYIHYRREERRELVLNYGAAGTELLPRALPYQAFIQYLRAFVPQPPSWIQKGFAIYFSGLSFSAGGEIDYRENLSWLDQARAVPSQSGPSCWPTPRRGRNSPGPALTPSPGPWHRFSSTAGTRIISAPCWNVSCSSPPLRRRWRIP